MFSNGRTVNGSKVSHTHNVDFHHLIPSQLTTRSHEILQIQHVFRFLTCENAPAIHLSGSLQVNELNINFLKLLQFYIIIPFLTYDEAVKSDDLLLVIVWKTLCEGCFLSK